MLLSGRTSPDWTQKSPIGIRRWPRISEPPLRRERIPVDPIDRVYTTVDQTTAVHISNVDGSEGIKETHDIGGLGRNPFP